MEGRASVHVEDKVCVKIGDTTRRCGTIITVHDTKSIYSTAESLPTHVHVVGRFEVLSEAMYPHLVSYQVPGDNINVVSMEQPTPHLLVLFSTNT